MNHYFFRIKENLSIKQVSSLESDVYKICRLFFNEEDRYNYMIFEEANTITYDFINKILGKNNRNLNLPINISYLKEYGISNLVKERDVDLVIYVIILELAIIESYI